MSNAITVTPVAGIRQAMQLPPQNEMTAAKDVEEGIRAVAAWVVNNGDIVGEYSNVGLTILDRSSRWPEVRALMGDWVLRDMMGRYTIATASDFKLRFKEV